MNSGAVEREGGVPRFIGLLGVNRAKIVYVLGKEKLPA